jgi:dihydropteroate synthase
MRWLAGSHQYEFPRPVLLMGIVNVTPDSFSDGGRYLDFDAAVQHGRALVDQGADLLDIGGESSRPFAVQVSADEEKRRVLPVICQLSKLVSVPLSIDTQKAEVAESALAAGASVINNIAANRTDQAMGRLVADSGAGYVAMHMQGTPQTMQVNPHYEDVTSEVDLFFQQQMDWLGHCGVRADQVVLDVGIGFGKNLEHNLELLAGLKRFNRYKRPLLLGVSRKSFISGLLGVDQDHRLPGCLGATLWSVVEGVQLIRTHDVAETSQAVRMMEAILARITA